MSRSEAAVNASTNQVVEGAAQVDSGRPARPGDGGGEEVLQQARHPVRERFEPGRVEAMGGVAGPRRGWNGSRAGRRGRSPGAWPTAAAVPGVHNSLRDHHQGRDRRPGQQQRPGRREAEEGGAGQVARGERRSGDVGSQPPHVGVRRRERPAGDAHAAFPPVGRVSLSIEATARTAGVAAGRPPDANPGRGTGGQRDTLVRIMRENCLNLKRIFEYSGRGWNHCGLRASPAARRASGVLCRPAPPAAVPPRGRCPGRTCLRWGQPAGWPACLHARPRCALPCFGTFCPLWSRSGLRDIAAGAGRVCQRSRREWGPGGLR